ncbi:MAG: thioredoxin domain-containing protein [Acidobacteria bacterium]|uniref:Thioredoxin domain-containing protein n=1 Tax=Candidatus Polarisedimenticola svalbardensis TaxID=2886004 RepID=A0A8J7C249_9BACT|nr:thioredoxin domain-containing protein [Candidatus Polarisedimenticola svalbardensis]
MLYRSTVSLLVALVCAVPCLAGLPGAEPFSPEMTAGLKAAVARFGPDYKPRSHFLNEDGSPRFTNRLALSTSPYLIQHAHNPVNWYPWGDEAFETARRLGRPVFLSVGYSTCHWCHVMEEESFEDMEIARFLNENYIAIKVDREERPDVDSVYMTAVQAMTGRGGWPMSVWLTADRKPFFGGTYFPARDGDRGRSRGFLSLLQELGGRYRQQDGALEGQAEQLTRRIGDLLAVTRPAVQIEAAAVIRTLVDSAGTGFDRRNGGRNGRPKFPSSFPIRTLLRHHRSTGDPDSLRMAVHTLERMAAGGIHDQVGGGFHRYTVDAAWQVPHFEKMLYDNAQLAMAYTEAYQLTGDENLAGVTRRILSYVQREMTSEGGGFYSATDADSLAADGEMEEGFFFTWTPREFKAAAGPDASPCMAYFGVTEQGNFEGRNILHVEGAAGAVQEEVLQRCREKLYSARAARTPPLLDDKILAAWNGLMISSFARAGFALDDRGLVRSGERAADFVLKNMTTQDGLLLRSYREGGGIQPAFLDDYAFMIQGLLDLYEVTGKVDRLSAAVRLQAFLDGGYQDLEHGGYFLTGSDHERLLAREKPTYDGAEPSGNSVAYLNLLRLHALTTDDGYRESAAKLLAAVSAGLKAGPGRMNWMLHGLDYNLGDPVEIVLVPGKKQDSLKPFVDYLRTTFLPSKVVVMAGDRKRRELLTGLIPSAAGKTARKGKGTAYVCRNGVCRLPATDLETFIRQLAPLDKKMPGT